VLLRRISVPRELSSWITVSDREVNARRAGMTPDGVERIWRATVQLYRFGYHPAITLCIRREGHVVLDRAIGWARGVAPGEPADAERVPVTPDTPFCIFSSSKAVTATVVHMLADRGTISLGDRVADYIPEYAGGGRDSTTIDHVLSHRAGIPFIPRDLIDLDQLADEEIFVKALPRMKARSEPGAALSYHAITGGFVLGELVKRVTGKDIRTVLQAEILDPLGFRWTSYGVRPEDVDAVGRSYPTGPILLPPLSLAITRALGLPGDEVTRISNDPRFLTAIVPAGNVVTTAQEMSRFMEILRQGGTLDGVTVMRPRTVRRAVAERSYHEIDRTLGMPIRFGSGYMLGARRLSLYGPDTDDAFGHLGFTNVMMWADPRREITVGLVTSGKPYASPHLGMLWRLMRTIGREAPKVARTTLERL
jgi:CubicO group peptidase (beta-lactamase class C family)